MNKTKSIFFLLPNSLRAWLAVSLLVIVSSFEFIKVIHVDHHHDNEMAVCTEDDESDACHRSIIHLDTTAGCEHNQHFEKAVASCEICEALVSSYTFEILHKIQLQNKFEEVIQFGSPLEKHYSSSIAIPALRGPPIMS